MKIKQINSKHSILLSKFDQSSQKKHTMGLGNIVDQFHNEYSFSDTGSTKKPNLSSTLIWCKEVNNLDHRHNT